MDRFQRNLWVLFAAFLLVACLKGPAGTWAAPPKPAPPAPATSAPTNPRRVFAAQPAPLEKSEALDYVEFVTGGAGPEDKLPMIVAIHGLGDSPEGFSNLVRGLEQPARVILPRGPDPWRRGFSWFSIRGADLSDGPWVKGVRRSASRIAHLISELQRNRPTAGKPLVMGFSQGGILSFALAIHYPHVLGLAVPIGGFLPGSLVPKKSADMAGAPPIVALHGEADTVIPFHLALSTMKQLKSLGVKIRLQGYPNVRHQVPPRIRAELISEIRGYLQAVREADGDKK